MYIENNNIILVPPFLIFKYVTIKEIITQNCGLIFNSQFSRKAFIYFKGMFINTFRPTFGVLNLDGKNQI